MRKFVAIILCILTVCLVFAFTGCDYQESIDSVRSDLMDGAKDMLDPFLNQSDGSTSSVNSSTDEADNRVDA